MDFWDQLLRIDFSGAPRCAWERLGQHFQLVEPALVPVGRIAKRVACPECGCNHRLLPEEDATSFRAICQCDEATCEDFTMPRDSVELLAIDVRRLPELFGTCLPLTPRLFPSRYSMQQTWKLGSVVFHPNGITGSLVVCFSARDTDHNNGAIGVSEKDLGQTLFVCRSDRADQVERFLPPDSMVVDFSDVWSFGKAGLAPAKAVKRLLSGWEGEAARSTAAIDSADYLYQKRGATWEVVFEGGLPFHIKDSLGAYYIGHLLHHPNKPIPCFDLEVAIKSEKATARGDTSIQPTADGTAIKSFLRDLDRLRSERNEAMEDGDHGSVDRIDGEIEAINTALRGAEGLVAGDKGEKARNNVRKAIDAVRTKLLKGSKDEKRFGQHLVDMLSTGHDCSYKSPAGRIWQ